MPWERRKCCSPSVILVKAMGFPADEVSGTKMELALLVNQQVLKSVLRRK